MDDKLGSRKGLLMWSVALILLIGCALGIILTMHVKSSNAKKDDDGKTMTSTSSVKAVTVICQPTEYKDACKKTLGPLSKNENATVTDYMLAAIRSAKVKVKKVLDAASKQKVDKDLNDGLDHARVEECKKLLSFALEDLESTVSTLDKSNNCTLGELIKDIRNWLTAVYSFQSQCKDAIEKSDKYKSPILKAMTNSTQLSDNALAIASGLSDIINTLGLEQYNINLSDLNLQPSRRLLQDDTFGSQDNSGYPTWFLARDRRLLLQPMDPGVQPDAVVAQDGSGQYKTIGEAVAAYPKTPLPLGKRYVIHVKTGVYNEQVLIQRHQENVFVYGDGHDTIVTCDKSVVKDKLDTPYTATFAVEGKGFIARSMTFRNTAGPEGEQAVALRIRSEGGVVYDCRIEGYQDTLLYHNYRQFYRDCVISGTIDFLFGEGAAVIQNSELLVRKPKAGQKTLVIAADGNEKPHQTGGLVIQNCSVKLDKDMEADIGTVRYNIYLGRPWMPAATSAIMESDLGGFLNPEGYVPWPQAQNEKTCRFFEYKNRGPGASAEGRVKWTTLSILNDSMLAQAYTAGAFIDGERWLRESGVPYHLGLIGS